MGIKKLTIEAPTVNEAIEEGLKEIGLSKEDTYIEVVQHENHGLFGIRPAIVSIAYDENESKEQLQESRALSFEEEAEILFEEGKALVKVPRNFYDENSSPIDKRLDTLINYLKKQGVLAPSQDLLQNIIKDSTAYQYFQAVKEYKVEPVNDKGVSIVLTPSQDMFNCQAILFFPKNSEETASFEEVLEILKQHSIFKGIFKKRTEKCLEERASYIFEIAKGKAPNQNIEGSLEIFFQEDEKKAFQEMMELLRIDTRDIKDLNICERNQLLMRIHSEDDTETEGYRIDGKPIKPIASQNTKVTLGQNVYFSEDNKEVYAKEAGHIRWDKKTKTVSVEPVYIVEGNIDFSEGNLVGFSGKVIIKGDVMPKFKVSVEGDIEVQGTVEDAIVESLKGSVTILGSVVHHNEGYIQAKEEVHATIAQNAKIYASHIYIQKEAMNCHLEAEHTVEVLGKPGALVGGVTKANKLIRANFIGSANWVKTAIHAGDIREDVKKIKKAKNELPKLKEEITALEQAHELLLSLKKSGSLSEAQEKQFGEHEEQIESIKEKISFLEKDIQFLSKKVAFCEDARVEVLDKLYPQVDVHIYNGQFIPSEEEIHSAFVCKEKRVDRRPL